MNALQAAKFWAWGWAGANGKHSAMNLRGETGAKKLRRITQRARNAGRRWKQLGGEGPTL